MERVEWWEDMGWSVIIDLAVGLGWYGVDLDEVCDDDVDEIVSEAIIFIEGLFE